MTDLANLGIRIESQEADVADKRLDDLAASADRAEKSVDSLAMAARRADGATSTMNVAVREQGRMLNVSRNAMGLTAAEGLNLSRQFADIGVTAAMGMNPLMIALQQGPQLLDIFQVAAVRTGMTVRATMMAAATGAWALVAPFAPLIATVALAGAAIGGVLALSARSANKEFGDLKDGLGLTDDQLKKVKDSTISLGDIVVATFQEVGEAIMDAFDGPIKSAQKQTTSFLDELKANTIKELKAVVGAFVGSYDVIRGTWRMLPAAIGDAAVTAANIVIRSVEGIVNGAASGINRVLAGIRALGAINPTFAWASAIRDIGSVSLNGLANPYGGAMNAIGAAGQNLYADGNARGAGYVDAGIDAVGRRARDNEVANIRRQAGDSGDTDAQRAARAAREVSETMWAMERIDLQPLNIQLIELVDPLKLIADEARLINGLAQESAQGLAEAFGESGRALGDLLVGMTAYQSRIAEINLAEKEHHLSAMQAERERAYAQVANYGDMLSAAKGFFQEGSEGYRFLQAAEAAYRVFQFAMSVQAMAQTAAETAASVAASGTKAAASTAAGAAKMFETLGPYAFPIVAAMVALLASLGMRGGGGGGSSKAVSASVGTSQGMNQQADQNRTLFASAVAQQVEVKVTADRDGLNAYVQQTAGEVARPMIAQGMAAAAGATRAQVFSDLDKSRTYDRTAG
ncbi:phage tail length tape measure family protein [Brevundimonas sp. NIBR11]|uniref:phage tail length tape measure family protein n=1 Tax=Brevundimonas sp. NIBR11 TaxID=3015999 RepID=UPI0022F00FAF|nr:phage tail length tape measure family protein [Brevundimonas sp. NIBR11]WGM31502.1 hypothetical protein KKHFBJBL_01749 [Brevundimonas sp. NIBR11]